MDSARDKITGEIIDAEQLWLIDPVDKSRYVCRGCNLPVIPASYRPENIPRPYFTKGKAPHSEGCDVDGQAILVERAKTARVSDPLDGFPAAYPDRLILRDMRVVTGDAPLSDQSPARGKRSSKFGEAENDRRNKTYTAGTIRPICRSFINFPFDRDRPLHLPDVWGSTYAQAFWRVRDKDKKIIRYDRNHLYYAPIRWSKPIETDAWLEVQLNAGEWENKKLMTPYRVRVAWHNWSLAKRNFTLKEIEVARHEAIQAGKANRAEKGWLFFIGYQDETDNSLFIVNDHRLICCLVVEMIDPPRDR